MHKLKHKILAIPVVFFVMVLLPATVEADISINCPDGYQTTIATADRADGACADHATGTALAVSTEAAQAADPGKSANLEADCKPANGAPLDQENCGIVGYILTFTNVLSALVGIVIVIMIAVGGVQYATAGDNPQLVSGAKTRIQNALLALVFYLFIFAFLQYLVPGGIF